MTEHISADQIFHETIFRMAVIAEHALPSIENHLRRIHGYAYLLGTGLGKSPAEAEVLAAACQLHDVGMVSIPASIIRKKTNLDNEEWELIRQHPEIGADLLKDLPHEIFRLGARIARSHHERWDGSGYPYSLKGEEIPLEGRICGLCDVFDTLTHPRAYKRAQQPDEVLLLLQEAGDSFFDPQIVDVFTLNYAKILAVRERFTNEPEHQPEAE